jgi:hypothetical protein
VVAVVRAVIGAKHRSARTGSKAQATAVENRSGPEINCCFLRIGFSPTALSTQLRLPQPVTGVTAHGIGRVKKVTSDATRLIAALLRETMSRMNIAEVTITL